MSEKSKLPAPQGPYSLWVKCGGLVFISGQCPIEPSTGEVLRGDIEHQTALTLDNLERVLADAGLGLKDVVKTTVFLAKMEDFAGMNEVYAARFGSVRPARSTIQAAGLPLGISVEIEAVAAAPGTGVERS